MKKYFAKYITTGEKVREGLTILLPQGTPAIVGSTPELFEGYPVVKMYLCSKNFTVGDTVYSKLKTTLFGIVGEIGKGGFWLSTETVEKIPKHGFGNWGKIIGEISPDALRYVKAGDEFDEDEIQRHHICYDTEANMGYCFHCQRSKGCDSQDYNYLIKGPCGHWH